MIGKDYINENDIDEREEFLALKQSVGWKLLIKILEDKKRIIVNRIVKEVDSIEEIKLLRQKIEDYDYIQNIVEEKIKQGV